MVNSSKYRSWMEISVEKVVQQNSSVTKITVKKKKKSRADDSHPEAGKRTN